MFRRGCARSLGSSSDVPSLTELSLDSSVRRCWSGHERCSGQRAIECYGSEALEHSVPEFGAEVSGVFGDMKGFEPNHSLQPTATAVVFRVGSLFSDAVAVAELRR